MRRLSARRAIFFLLFPAAVAAQAPVASSFLREISDRYSVEIALAPELIPTLDSLRQSGTTFASLEAFLQALVSDQSISFQILDGDKVMLRREMSAPPPGIGLRVTGTIVSGRDGQPLPFATVMCPSEQVGVHSGEGGAFQLVVPDSLAEIHISYLGYRTEIKTAGEILRNGTRVALREARIPLRQVTIVVPYRSMGQNYDQQSLDITGYTYLSADEWLTWNSDRLLLSMTGYTSFTSEQGLRIRGSDPGNSLFLLDGIPVYNPYHFYNIYSPYSGIYFSGVEIFKNNFPVEYGGRIDGLVRANATPRHAQVGLLMDADLLQAGAAGEVAITPDLRLAAGVRSSHLGILENALGDSSVTNFTRPGGFRNENEWTTTREPGFSFYDINARLSGTLGDGADFSLAFFDSRDQLDLRTTTALDLMLAQQGLLRIRQQYTSRDEWANRGYAGTFSKDLSAATRWQTDVYHARYTRDVSFETLLSEERNGQLRQIRGEGFQDSRLTSTGVRSYIHRTTAAAQEVKFGLDLAWHDVMFEGRENDIRYINQSQEETELTLFGAVGVVPASRLSVDLGGRMTWLRHANELAVLPNIQLRYQLGEHTSLRAAWSKNLQALRSLTSEDRFGRETHYLILASPDKGYPVLRSDKYMVGIGYSSVHWGLDLELFYKQSDGLTRLRALRPDPSYSDPVSPEDYYRLFHGRGRTGGVDVTVFFKQKYLETSLLYTLSRMTEQYDELFSGEPFGPQEDRRHQVKWASRYVRGRFAATGLFTWKSRAPYLSFVELEGNGGIGDALRPRVFRYLPAFVSLDLGLDYRFTIAGIPALLGVAVVNVTNHHNVDDILHLGRLPRETGRNFFLTQETSLLGRTGNVRLRMVL